MLGSLGWLGNFVTDSRSRDILGLRHARVTKAVIVLDARTHARYMSIVTNAHLLLTRSTSLATLAVLRQA